MSSITAKLFEWHRVDTQLREARVRLKRAMGSPEEDASIVQLYARTTELQARADELLRELEQLRTIRASAE